MQIPQNCMFCGFNAIEGDPYKIMTSNLIFFLNFFFGLLLWLSSSVLFSGLFLHRLIIQQDPKKKNVLCL